MQYLLKIEARYTVSPENGGKLYAVSSKNGGKVYAVSPENVGKVYKVSFENGGKASQYLPEIEARQNSVP